ncbi:hypothetical protein DFQ26_005745 [Actinomortierella ambigua]|nr:hypothetical protein DFQ26_005745 [Actinomortierella ambigua]
MDTIFIDSAPAEQVVELATYISSLRGDEEQALVKEVTPIVEAEKLTEATKVILRESKTLLESPEREFEGAFNLLAALVMANEDKALLAEVLKIVSSDANQKTAIKFKVLSNIFNILPANSAQRLTVFSTIVDLAAASDEIDLVIPQLPYVSAWIQEWGVSVDEERALYLSLSDRLKETGNTKQSLDLLLKYLTTFNGASQLDAQKPLATRAVVESLGAADELNFENLLKIDAIQHLKGEKVYELLSVFLNGNVQDYRQLVAKHTGLVGELKLDEEENLRKMRLLSLASLGSEHLTRELGYAQIAEALEISEDEVEMWVIDVIRAGLVEAKLNQVAKTAIINRSIYRTFGNAQWQQLHTRLEGWKQSLQDILQVVANAKLTTDAAISTAVVTNN